MRNARTFAGFFAAMIMFTFCGRARADETKIDRHALVERHEIVVHDIIPSGTMAVGNGEFAFNFDVTGLQSFPDYYEKTMPLGILSTWGWHSFPNPMGYSPSNFKMTVIKKNAREFVYPAASTSNPPPDAAYLRSNPQRFGLGRIGLDMTHADGSPIKIEELKNITEKLNIWDGICDSTFEVDGQPVHVQTVAHPNQSEMATRVESPLIALGRLKLRIGFAYASTSFGPDYQDWDHPYDHQTVVSNLTDHGVDFARTLDATKYIVRALWSGVSSFSAVGKHQYVLTGNGPSIELAMNFSPGAISSVDAFDQVKDAAAAHWHDFWNTGGAIDLSGNDDPRAMELERRLVLSEYVMAVHDAGSYPPQETGLAANSWYGKFHMEMYWWHAAHWALWGRPEILQKSLDHLKDLMPAGQAMAKLEGCDGVKWSKMTDPSGTESPSGVGPVLVWQQPHPIYLAELIWHAHHDRATLERYQEIVFQTADYMASFVDFDPQRGKYVLGPGVASADEKHTDYAHNLNPTMELGYWKWALVTAQQWRIRMGMKPDPKWQKVIDQMAPLTIRNGVYPAVELPEENSPATMATWLYGPISADGIDLNAMRNTLHAVMRMGGMQNAVTWGVGMQAMCAARLGEPDRAIDLLVGKYQTNPFMPSGYTVRRPEQTPMYMPANGAWLSAAAMMAAGWDGNTQANPGFPKNWKVKWENLEPMP